MKTVSLSVETDDGGKTIILRRMRFGEAMIATRKYEGRKDLTKEQDAEISLEIRAAYNIVDVLPHVREKPWTALSLPEKICFLKDLEDLDVGRISESIDKLGKEGKDSAATSATP